MRSSFSGSLLALPSSVTFAPSDTVWSEPASAVGASLAPAVTVIVTVSAVEAEPLSSVTVSENTREASDASCVGAVKVGLSAVVELRVTVGEPEVWLQE